MTDMTDAGRKLPPVDPARPAYFVLQSGGFLRTADAAPNASTVSPEVIDRFVRRALRRRGYLPATSEPGKAPTLVLVYAWGVHARPRDNEALTPQELARNFQTRAALVGGDRLAAQLTELMRRSAAQADIPTPTKHLTLDDEPVAPVLGPEQLEFMNPIEQFRNASARNEALLEQVGNDVYFVVVSAYAGAELAHGRRVLLWRTRMTAATEGIASADAMPALIDSASPYLGKETPDVAILAPRSGAAGRVDYGPLEVKEWDAKIAPPPEKK